VIKEKNIFIYTVCGDNIHIDTLNISLQYLKHFSKNEIIVVTDKSRNNKQIDHDNIIDIKTPTEFDNHQASIYLKTSLHKYVDFKHNYCYLDSDVIAINREVDDIFNYYNSPITFAKDHCKLNEFSPFAINCGCKEDREKERKSFFSALKEINNSYDIEKLFANENSRELFSTLYNIRQRPFYNIFKISKYFFQKVLLPFRYYKLNNKYILDKKDKVWLDTHHNIVMHDIQGSFKEIEENTNFHIHKLKKTWHNKRGENIFKMECLHLHEEINEKYNISIQPKNWQHWNGGVFLFNENSIDFMNNWHKWTIENFQDPKWKIRDQGTLAATVWKFKLQNHKTLPSEYNFLADFYKPQISYKEGLGFTLDNFRTIFHPKFIHIYHHFGDKDWNIWKHVESLK